LRHTTRHLFFFFSSRRRHTRFSRDWSSDVCSSDLWCIMTSHVHLVVGTTSPSLEGIVFHAFFNFISIQVCPHLRIIFSYPKFLRSEERRVGKDNTSRWCLQR